MSKREVLFVSEDGGTWPWARQMREPENRWGSTHYTFGTKTNLTPDWLVVFSAWPEVPLDTGVPRNRRIFVAGEPESFHRYQNRFLEQFGTVITTQRCTRHTGAIYGQPGINWFVGVRFQDHAPRHLSTLTFADLESSNPNKTKLCSVVCSSKTITRGHRERIAFVDLLQRNFPDQIDFFGRGRREIADKDEALAEYRFHIALENSVQKDYWTEKLADPFLRGCYPIYSGCPNLESYFPDGSFSRISLDKPKTALVIVRSILEGNLDETRSDKLAEAKRRVLFEHNIFAMLEKVFAQKEQYESRSVLSPGPVQSRLYTDHDTKDFKLSRRIRRWANSFFDW